MTLELRARTYPFRSIAPAVGADGRYTAVSYWQETVDVQPREALAEDTACDVLVVGGGFTGLSVACAVKRAAPQLDVVLVERAVIGHGASGRNGGFAMPLIGWDLTDVARKVGQAKAAETYVLMYDAVDHLRNEIKRHGIECEMEETGYLLLATCTARLDRVRHEAELGRALGFPLSFLDREGVREHIESDAFLGGVFDPRPFVLNPFKLARGLLGVAEQLGVRVYEQTPVQSLTNGEVITAVMGRGRVRARQLVLALNGYGASMGFMERRIHPVHTFIVMTEPLGNDDLDRIGWGRRRTSLETARNFIHYFRLTADNRILYGGEDAQLFYGGALRDYHAPSFARLEARFREYFPELSHIRFLHRWGGVLGVTLDMLPTIGVGGERRNVYHAAGYSGHGVALSNYAGHLLAPHILRRAGVAVEDQTPPAPAPIFWNRRPTAIPPDPFRYLGLQAYRFALRQHDRIQGA
jgi:glycine/D-amino acid oxidase-like deaminating enzyme